MSHLRRSLPMFAIASLTLLAGAAPALAVPHPHPVITIAQARALPLGTEVTVKGTVTTPSGAFESSFFDKGFGLQDETAGIYVTLQDDLHLHPFREVRVTGILTDQFGLLVIAPADPSDVKRRGEGDRVRPEFVQTVSVSEATEGRIVRVVGRISQAPTSDLPYGYKFSVDDGSGEAQIFVNTQTGIDVGTLALGELVSVTGFSSQFDTHWEIDPRRPGDIVKPSL
jgi:hypothetical protein